MNTFQVLLQRWFIGKILAADLAYTTDFLMAGGLQMIAIRFGRNEFIATTIARIFEHRLLVVRFQMYQELLVARERFAAHFAYVRIHRYVPFLVMSDNVFGRLAICLTAIMAEAWMQLIMDDQ